MKKIISILVALGLVLGLSMVAAPVAAQCTGTGVTACTVVVTPKVECENGTYNITFKATSGLGTGEWISVKFPTTAVVTGAVAKVNGTAATVNVVTGGEIHIVAPAAISAGSTVRVDVTNVSNPPDGTYNLCVKTVWDQCPCCASFTILPGGYLNPATATWGINSCKNVTFPIIWEGSTSIIAVNGLTSGTDFAVVANTTLHIACAYLTGLNLTPCATQTFEVDFSPGCNTTVTITAFASCNVSLGVGWNLMSLPLIPMDTDIEDVLAPIDANVVSVWYYDCGSWYVYKNGTSFDTLETMDYCASYWVCMNASATLQVTGWEYECPPAVPPKCCYHECWNMVGFKSCVTMNASTYLASLSPAGAIFGMLTWNGTAWQIVTASTTLNPGQGYWMAFIADACFVPPL